jgi:hypothetical protein
VLHLLHLPLQLLHLPLQLLQSLRLPLQLLQDLLQSLRLPLQLLHDLCLHLLESILGPCNSGANAVASARTQAVLPLGQSWRDHLRPPAALMAAL